MVPYSHSHSHDDDDDDDGDLWYLHLFEIFEGAKLTSAHVSVVNLE